MSGGQVEIRDGLAEGDVVVARAGALLREGDPVRPVTQRGREIAGLRSRIGLVVRDARRCRAPHHEGLARTSS